MQNKIKEQANEFLKFILIGIINTVVGAVTIFAFYNFFHLGYWLSSASSYFITSVLSFFLNKRFTFCIRSSCSTLMVASFVSTISLSYFLAYGISKPVMQHVFGNYPQNIRENMALLVGMCFFTVLNYIGQRFVVFGTERKNGA